MVLIRVGAAGEGVDAISLISAQYFKINNSVP